MATFTVQEIVRATQGALVVGDLGVPVTGVSIDSRTLGVGEAFFAIVRQAPRARRISRTTSRSSNESTSEPTIW